jgi:hypothetical protein
MLSEGREVPIVVEQFVIVVDAERCDQAVDGLAHRDATPSQGSVVVGGG